MAYILPTFWPKIVVRFRLESGTEHLQGGRALGADKGMASHFWVKIEYHAQPCIHGSLLVFVV